MALAQTIRDDQVKRLADCFALCKTEDAFSCGIPHHDGATCVTNDECVADRRYKLGEINGCLHILDLCIEMRIRSKNGARLGRRSKLS